MEIGNHHARKNGNHERRMIDDRDPPIAPLDYVSGVTVVNIGDVRVARGMSRRHHSSCPHIQLIYDQNERRIWCNDCERDVEAFDAFRGLVERYSSAVADLKQRVVSPFVPR